MAQTRALLTPPVSPPSLDNAAEEAVAADAVWPQQVFQGPPASFQQEEALPQSGQVQQQQHHHHLTPLVQSVVESVLLDEEEEEEDRTDFHRLLLTNPLAVDHVANRIEEESGGAVALDAGLRARVKTRLEREARRILTRLIDDCQEEGEE